MINTNLPKQEQKDMEDNAIRLKDGEEFTGVILEAEEVTTSFGPAIKFTFEIGGKKMVLFTSSSFLIGKLNSFEKGDVLNVQREGMGKATRWTVKPVLGA